jgi:hypothetical protein
MGAGWWFTVAERHGDVAETLRWAQEALLASEEILDVIPSPEAVEQLLEAFGPIPVMVEAFERLDTDGRPASVEDARALCVVDLGTATVIDAVGVDPTPRAPDPDDFPEACVLSPLPEPLLVQLFATATPDPAQVAAAEDDLIELELSRNDGRYIETTLPDGTPGPIAFFGWSGD